MINKHGALAVLAAAVGSTPVHASVAISSAATENMNCSGVVCAPTANSAVLNVSDLENMLAAGNVEVTTTGSGNVQAKNIDINAAISWASSSVLGLDAFQSLKVNKPISVVGQAGLMLVTNDGGSGGDLSFGPRDAVTFSNLASSLTINGASYMLVSSVQGLANAIAGNSDGNFALANDYNAKPDGTYSTVPVPTTYSGIFEGLGHAISSLKINDSTDPSVGLFATLASTGALRDIALDRVKVVTNQNLNGAIVGALAGTSFGLVSRASSSGSLSGGKGAGSVGTAIGGLLGYAVSGSTTMLSRSSASVTVVRVGEVGGLIAASDGLLSRSYATGMIMGGAHSLVGGLVGGSSNGTIENSYASGNASGTRNSFVGGLIGECMCTISSAYSIGAVSTDSRHRGIAGGFIGFLIDGSVSNAYWDTTTSGTDVGVGNGSQSGVTGLTTEQLQSALPQGFDPAIWGEIANINNGFPYLLAIPPK